MAIQRISSLDALKGIAIIAVILYHVGYVKFGYLGVDVFLVIAGYLSIHGMCGIMPGNGGGKSYLSYIIKRLARLWPVLLVASLVSIVWGYFWMLPDDYENLAQSVAASDLFANNILQCITTKNYWDVVNEFKPLMHTWYLGVVFEFYLVMPLLLIIGKKCFPNAENIAERVVTIVTICSFLLFLLTCFRQEQKFYYLPFRFFEMGMGCWLALVQQKVATVKNSSFHLFGGGVLLFLLLLLIFVDVDVLQADSRLILCVLLTLVMLVMMPVIDCSKLCVLTSNPVLVFLGRSCYSIFIWHQIVLAFMRYSYSDKFGFGNFMIFLVITIGLSCVTYFLIEKKFIQKCKSSHVVMVSAVVCCLSIACSLWIYVRAGVMKDIPELDIRMDNVHRGMHAEYCDRGYQFDKDFKEKNKQHWLVVGDSFGRDFVNVLVEMGITDSVEISYIFTPNLEKKEYRIPQADRIFYAMSVFPKEDGVVKFDNMMSQYHVEDSKWNIIGSKNFGVSCGQIYRHHGEPDYTQQSMEIDSVYFSFNAYMKKQWGEKYIDLVSPVAVGKNRVKVFSDTGKIISQDCRHLTKGGAQYYAKLLRKDINMLLR